MDHVAGARGRLNVHGSTVLLMAMSLVAAVAPDSPVADAAMAGDAAEVRTLVSDGADVNAPQGDGMTALHWAARHGDEGLAAFLIDAGADVAAQTRIGAYTPLHLAAEAGAGPVVALLLEAGAAADQSTVGVGGATPLHFAAAAGTVDGVEALLRHGAPVDAREHAWGQTPLIFAANEGRIEVVRALLAAGADPSVTTRVIDVAARAVSDRLEEEARNEAIDAGKRWDPPMTRLPRPVDMVAERGEVEEGRRARAEAVSRAQADQRMIEEPEPLSYGELVGGHGGLTALLHAVHQGRLDTLLPFVRLNSE